MPPVTRWRAASVRLSAITALASATRPTDVTRVDVGQVDVWHVDVRDVYYVWRVEVWDVKIEVAGHTRDVSGRNRGVRCGWEQS